MSKENSRSWVVYGMVIICLILLVSHSMYVIRTYQYPAAGLDEHAYLSMAVSFYDNLKEPSLATLSNIINFNRYRQPLYGVFLALPLLIFGTDHTYKIALWMNILFYLATVIGTYFLAREFLSKKASFFASFLFSFYGFPLFYLHFTYSETAVTSFIVLALLFLSKSKNFLHTKYTILFSIFFAFGNLVRWVVPLFVGGAVLYSLFGAVTRQFSARTRNIRQTCINIALFIFIGIVPVLVLLYIPNFSYFSQYILIQKNNEVDWAIKWLGSSQFGNLFSIQSLTYYFYILAQQTIFFMSLFILGFIISLILFKRYTFLILTFIVAYVSLTLGTTWKGDRFIVPIYPIMGIISAVVFDSIKNKKIEILLIVLTIIVGLLNFIGASWGIGPMKFSVDGGPFVVPNSIVIPMPIGHARRIWLAPISWPPRSNESNVDRIVKTLNDDWGNQKAPFRLLFTYEMNQINDHLFTIYSYEKRHHMVWSGFRDIPKDRYDIFFQRFRDIDYVVTKNGIVDNGISEGADVSWDNLIYFIRKFNNAMNLSVTILPEAFAPIARIPIPFDKSTLTIYKKQREITREEWIKFGERMGRTDSNAVNLIMNATNSITDE